MKQQQRDDLTPAGAVNLTLLVASALALLTEVFINWRFGKNLEN